MNATRTANVSFFATPPWEGFERERAQMGDHWMNDQWPVDSGNRGGALPPIYVLQGLDPELAQRMKAYLAIQLFWHAWEQAQAIPEGQVVWGVDYDVLEDQNGDNLSFTAISDFRLRATLEHHGHERSLLPQNAWPERLAEGLSGLGLEMAHWRRIEGVVLAPEQDLRGVLEQQLGKNYAVWWQHQHLAHHLSPSGPSATRPRF